MSLDVVELVMALEEFTGAEGDWIDVETTLGDLHWLLVRNERGRGHPRRSSEEIWLALAQVLEENGVPGAQIRPEIRIVDLLSGESPG